MKRLLLISALSLCFLFVGIFIGLVAGTYILEPLSIDTEMNLNVVQQHCIEDQDMECIIRLQNTKYFLLSEKIDTLLKNSWLLNDTAKLQEQRAWLRGDREKLNKSINYAPTAPDSQSEASAAGY